MVILATVVLDDEHTTPLDVIEQAAVGGGQLRTVACYRAYAKPMTS